MSRIRKKDVAKFIMACLNQLEAGGYQEFEKGDGTGGFTDPVIDAEVRYGYLDDTTLYFDVGGRRFFARVSLKRN